MKLSEYEWLPEIKTVLLIEIPAYTRLLAEAEILQYSENNIAVKLKIKIDNDIDNKIRNEWHNVWDVVVVDVISCPEKVESIPPTIKKTHGVEELDELLKKFRYEEQPKYDYYSTPLQPLRIIPEKYRYNLNDIWCTTTAINKEDK